MLHILLTIEHLSIFHLATPYCIGTHFGLLSAIKLLSSPPCYMISIQSRLVKMKEIDVHH